MAALAQRCRRSAVADSFSTGSLARRRAGLFYAQDIRNAANATHGLRRTNEDKRRAVTTLLNDIAPTCEKGHVCPQENRCWATWSDREIARQSNVSQPFVSALRPRLTDNVISERTYNTKHGTTSTMNTANIGGRKDDGSSSGVVFDNTECASRDEPVRCICH
jgi:hypothetical protein